MIAAYVVGTPIIDQVTSSTHLEENEAVRILIPVVAALPIVLLFRFVFIAPYLAYQAEKELRESYQQRLHDVTVDTSDMVFDMSSSQAAQYVMDYLDLDLKDVGKFVMQMVSEGRIHIRAIELDRSTDCPIPADIFEEYELHLVGTDEQRQHNDIFGCAFHNNGWIEERVSIDLANSLRYHSPRFSSDELERTVAWYKKSRPGQSR